MRGVRPSRSRRSRWARAVGVTPLRVGKPSEAWDGVSTGDNFPPVQNGRTSLPSEFYHPRRPLGTPPFAGTEIMEEHQAPGPSKPTPLDPPGPLKRPSWTPQSSPMDPPRLSHGPPRTSQGPPMDPQGPPQGSHVDPQGPPKPFPWTSMDPRDTPMDLMD